MSRRLPYHVSRKRGDTFYGTRGRPVPRPSEPARMAEIDDPAWAAWQERQMIVQHGRVPEGTAHWSITC